MAGGEKGEEGARGGLWVHTHRATGSDTCVVSNNSKAPGASFSFSINTVDEQTPLWARGTSTLHSACAVLRQVASAFRSLLSTQSNGTDRSAPATGVHAKQGLVPEKGLRRALPARM